MEPEGLRVRGSSNWLRESDTVRGKWTALGVEGKRGSGNWLRGSDTVWNWWRV